MAVLAETTVQVLVEDDVTLPLPAEKIDEIVASVRDLTCFVIPNKVIFQGTLHKQIFFVDLDSFVRHVGVDIPFSGFVDLPGVPADAACRVTGVIEFIQFDLITSTLLRETVVIMIEVTVFEGSAEISSCNNRIPVTPVVFGEPNTVRVKSSGIITQTR